MGWRCLSDLCDAGAVAAGKSNGIPRRVALGGVKKGALIQCSGLCFLAPCVMGRLLNARGRTDRRI